MSLIFEFNSYLIMAGRIPQEFIDELLARTDIVEIVETRITLKKTGRNHTGLCPFHNEKTPSFSVSSDKQFYYCFGCQESGTALRFVMEFDRLDFFSAVELLAQRLGMEVPRPEFRSSAQNRERQARTKSLFDVLASASGFYKTQLRKHDSKDRAVSYLKDRGVSGEVARDFELGYAPPGWDNLMLALATSNLDRQLLIDGGLLVDNPEEGKTYDRFRDRIIFPIKDIRGRVIGFGGRIIGDGKPKYLNSPETSAFHKGRELYGLYEARKANRRLKSLVVVEGYMDVVALRQHGVTNAVATLGTATSKDHLERIYHMVTEVIFCFDGDSAGRNAAWKALEEVLPLMKDGHLARFLFLPEGEDPDSLIRKQGTEKFQLLLDEAYYLPDFFFDNLGSRVPGDTLEGKAEVSRLALPLIDRIPEGVFKQLMLDRLAEVSGLSLERLLHVVRPPKRHGESSGGVVAGRRPSSGVKSGAFEDSVMRLMLKQPELVCEFEPETYARLAVLPECALLLTLIEVIQNDLNISPVMLVSRFQDTEVFPKLKELAEAEEILEIEDWSTLYKDLIHALLSRLDRQAAEELGGELLKKSFSSWTPDEKQLLKTVVKK